MKNNYIKTEAIKEFVEKEGWAEEEAKTFVSLVQRYLDGAGYFMADHNIHNLPRPDDWINYSDRDFGRWLLDMALQYNMEHGKEYKVQ